MSKVKEALKAAKDTKALWMAPGIIAHVADLFKEQFPSKRAAIIADGDTYRIAGQYVVNSLRAGGVKQEGTFIFTDADLYAEYTYVDQLTDFLKDTNAIPIAVGSGTINDLTKLAAHLTGRPYMSVATAASMDGYTSFGASITADGAKQTFQCPAPRACLADIEIIRNAPPEMTAAGYADLFAKVVAGADWICADMLGIEPIDAQAWDIVQGGLLDALSDPEGVRDKRPEAITKLMEGLMLGGFAMQWTETSRPASGAEHQFSHLWNMEHHLNNGEPVSHGFQVSIATIAIIALYEQALQTPLEKLAIEDACRAWLTPEASDQNAIEQFKGTDFPDIGLRETRAKYINKAQLREQLELLKQRWPSLKEKLERQLIPYEQAVYMLQTVGAPVEPEQIGLSRAQLRDTFIRAQLLRRRFTVLDLAVRTNQMEPWLNNLFGAGKRWQVHPSPNSLQTKLSAIKHVALDMDGTIYKGNTLFPFTISVLDELKKNGIRYSFLTNNSSKSRKNYLQHLTDMGITATPDEVYTSGQAAIDFLRYNHPNIQRLFILGTPGLIEEFEEAGFISTEDNPDDRPDAVMIGFDTSLNYPRLCRAAWWVHQRLPYIATNPDKVCPTDLPTILVDCGSICAGIEKATGRGPDVVIGKPDSRMLDGIMHRYHLEPHEIMMVGDRLYTDIYMAHQTGAFGALVLTGEATTDDLKDSPFQPDIVTKDLSELKDMLLQAIR